MKDLGSSISQIRKSKGLSQEELAESAKINLRTIQRIESGETEPHGHTLRNICKVLDVQIEEVFEFTKEMNNNYIAAIHFSALTYLLFPLANIIFPLILWLAKKGSIINLSYYSKKLLNFQLTWTIVTFFPFALMFIQSVLHIRLPFDIPFMGFRLVFFMVAMYGLNLIYTLIAGILSSKSVKRNLFPIAIPFMRT